MNEVAGPLEGPAALAGGVFKKYMNRVYNKASTFLQK